MKSLWLLRHAKSAWDTDAASDFERPLAKRGHRDAPRVGCWLRENQVDVDRIVCSSALRARQTLEGLQKHWISGVTRVEYSDVLYHAGTEDLLRQLHRGSQAEQSLMLVGHNPGFDNLLMRLVEQRILPLTAKGKLMTTAALAHLQLSHWQAKSAQLMVLVRPKELT